MTKSLTLSQKIERLEEIKAQFESADQRVLETHVELFKEASSLAKDIKKELNSLTNEVTKITKDFRD